MEDGEAARTTVLRSLESGRDRSSDELLPILYAELRSLAAALMARQTPGQTLQPTALVHEAYLRLVGDSDPGWNGRGHFFGSAARAMRQILVDQARRKGARKRGGDLRRVDADADMLPIAAPEEDVLALDAALDRLEALDPRKAQIVTLRYFAGLTVAETALALGVSVRTVERDWNFARALLHAWMQDPEAH